MFDRVKAVIDPVRVVAVLAALAALLAVRIDVAAFTLSDESGFVETLEAIADSDLADLEAGR